MTNAFADVNFDKIMTTMIALPAIRLGNVTTRAVLIMFWSELSFVELVMLVAESSICKLESYLSYKPFYMWLFQAKSRFNCILCLKTKAAGSIWFKDKLDAEPIQKLLERFALSYFMHSRPNIFINMQRSSSKFLQESFLQ